MGERFSIDPDQLRAQAPKFDRIGTDVAATVERLRTALAAEGAPWGDDDAGRAFAESYGPENERTMSDLESLVQVLRQSGTDLRHLANNVEYQDLASGQQIHNAGGGITNGSTLLPVRNGAAIQPGANTTAPPTTAHPFAGSTVPTTTTAAPLTYGSPDTAAAHANPPASGNGAPAAEQGPGRMDGTQPGRNRPGAAHEGAPGATVNPVRQADATRAPRVQNGPTATPWTRTATPWTRPAATVAAAPGSPWSKAAAGPPPQIAATGPGANDAPPRMPGRPAARPGDKASKPDPKPTVNGSGESVAARLARKLAERHGVRAFGFDTSGVPEEVLSEIVAAVGDVLPRYSDIDLRAIGIDELPDGETTRLEWDSEPRPSNPEERMLFTARIVLAVRAATDPEYLAQAITGADRAGLLAPGCARRPVYSSIVRELGGALDVAGGFRARSAVQRALLTAYLPQLSPADRSSLGRTVSGFREWRSQLRGRGFRGGRFEPAAALAESFTEVVLNAAQAAPPAQVLHGLLVRTAGSLGSP